MHDGRAAKRYARALFNAAKAQNIVTSVSDDLNVIVAAVTQSEKFRDFLRRPETSRDQKLTVLEKTFGDKVTALSMGFLRLLVDKGRDEELVGIRLEFEELRRQAESVVRAVITSAEPLDDGQRRQVVSTIESKTGLRLEAEYEVDASLIGGIRVAYDNYVLDGSLRGHLDRLRERLVFDVLKQF